MAKIEVPITMNILVLNCGSSSLKFQIITTDINSIENDKDQCLVKGQVERIGSQSLIKFEIPGQPTIKKSDPIPNYQAAIELVLRWVISEKSGITLINSYTDIHAVGHRVVHGGEHFSKSIIIDQTVIEGIEDCVELAPLHNPANIKGIKITTKILGGDIPQVAVFDTAFHSSMPEEAYLYGLPYEYYRRHKIRRYGFHGTSHRYIAYQYRAMTGVSKEKTDIISLHLGNGCSASAIKNGISIDTSMGFTPLEGLLMGTRSGDIDASILEYLHLKEGMDFNNLDNMLNKRSGLLGISGLTSDMRELLEEESEKQDRRAKLAIDIFCRRIRRYIGKYFVEMQGEVSAVVFTGGIGENSAQIRRRICMGLECLGLELDLQKNEKMPNDQKAEITSGDSKLHAYVIPTNEELMIARDTFRATMKKGQ